MVTLSQYGSAPVAARARRLVDTWEAAARGATVALRGRGYECGGVDSQ